MTKYIIPIFFLVFGQQRIDFHRYQIKVIDIEDSFELILSNHTLSQRVIIFEEFLDSNLSHDNFCLNLFLNIAETGVGLYEKIIEKPLLEGKVPLVCVGHKESAKG